MSEGWICPRCGRALAPWMSECPCYMNKLEITSNYTIGAALAEANLALYDKITEKKISSTGYDHNE